jgi:hypothetical protein
VLYKFIGCGSVGHEQESLFDAMQFLDYERENNPLITALTKQSSLSFALTDLANPNVTSSQPFKLR